MPKANPKHNKRKTLDSDMGVKKGVDRCNVENCSVTASNHLAFSNLEGYLKELKWTVVRGKRKTRAALCKKHYKEYKKLKGKEEKYANFKRLDSHKMPKPEKSHNFLE
jgi:hypothetical protein